MQERRHSCFESESKYINYLGTYPSSNEDQNHLTKYNSLVQIYQDRSPIIERTYRTLTSQDK